MCTLLRPTAKEANAIFWKYVARILQGNDRTPAYNVCMALMSHVFSADLRRGAGSTRLWAQARIDGTALGLAHLMVHGKVKTAGVSSGL
eukprot:2553019-Amphidinium_carterae.1